MCRAVLVFHIDHCTDSAHRSPSARMPGGAWELFSAKKRTRCSVLANTAFSSPAGDVWSLPDTRYAVFLRRGRARLESSRLLPRFLQYFGLDAAHAPLLADLTHLFACVQGPAALSGLRENDCIHAVNNVR